ncbi:membrane protein [Actinoplanes philippinensis]|uniref:Putative drug exporter of the RND superfamily n=1 Tax=Actinoplanes philippinensis TaxID=35752 RepID=A0A1I1ZM05_9ACTN|nr:MMPL family transporter [Actinoplanes philippinensis]GIE75412.1 membrane protein [Actinoplanes philippinensis]SFE32652.1 putative drug exporter of the RND superfamily [Actinoplanes philippinensis]
MSAARPGTRTHRLFTVLGRAAVRRPWWTITGWLLSAAAVAALVVVFGRPVDDDTTLPGSSAQHGRDLLDEHFPGAGGATGTVILRSASGPVAAGTVTDVSARLSDVAHVTSVAPPSAAAGTLTADGTTGYLTVQFDVEARDLGRDVIDEVLSTARTAAGPGTEVLPGGVLARSETDTRRSEALGLAVALVVLVLAFGGLVAAALPLLTALLTLVCGLGVIGLAGHLTAVPAVATTIATMIGLGVGVDYALFMITRYRALLSRGAAVPEAITATVVSSGSAVAFAGGTVVVALAGLAVSGVPILTTLGWTAGLIVLVAVTAAVTLLPALLAVLGPRVDALPVLRRRRAAAVPGHDAPPGGHSAWGRLADRVTRRPWPYALVSTVLLAVVAAPVTGMTLGQTDAGDEPPGTPGRAGYDALAEAFGPGVNGPLTLVAEFPEPAAPVAGAADPRVGALVTAAGTVAGVAETQPARVSADGRLVSVRVVPLTGPGDPATVATAAALERVPAPGAAVYVTGPTAVKAALAERVGARMPYVVGLVVVLAALLVLAAFGAPVVAAKAAVMNLFSVAAAYGVLTAVFQRGWGVTLLGLDGPAPIESYVPMLLFALLFGLSMDYEVFLLTAVRESWDATGDNRRSVREGLAGTGMVITSAAVVMVCVFGGFVLSSSPVVKMTGLGLAVAVAVDATVIRGVLVPAAMALLGRANWWTPFRARSRQHIHEVAAGQDAA